MLFEGRYGGVNKTLKSKQIKDSYCKISDIGKTSTLLFHNAMCPLIKMKISSSHSNITHFKCSPCLYVFP